MSVQVGVRGRIQKLKSTLNTLISTDSVVHYSLPVGDTDIPLNAYLGKTLSLVFQQEIRCLYCDRVTQKSYSQGYCFPCAKTLARTDFCIVKPEICHYHLGTCREPEWAKTHCMIPHIIYIANTSGIKVGITRETQIPTRWIDQGATQALPLFRVQTRYQSGLVEVVLKKYVSDKTDWRKMLKGEAEKIDLRDKQSELLRQCALELSTLETKLETHNESFVLERLENQTITTIQYPVLEYPQTVKALSFEKTPEITGILLGIKGQYLIFDKGVLNVRSMTGYMITFE